MMKNMSDLSQARDQALVDIKNYDCRILVCSGTGRTILNGFLKINHYAIKG